jgi:hypothetical protein
MYLTCQSCDLIWASCECDDWDQTQAMERAEIRDGYRCVDGRLTPKGIAVFAFRDLIEIGWNGKQRLPF